MDDERVALIVQVVAQGFEAAGAGMAGLAKAGQDVAQHFNQDANGALQAFGVNLSALNSPLTALASGMKASIDETVQWAGTIDKLSRASGEGAEETSKMAVVLGDFGINVDSLDRTVKAFTKNGLQFNMATLEQLAAKYQAIRDPVERDKFAFDNFGRSAMDMTEILSKTPEQLKAIGDAAQYSGKIMNEQGVEAVQHFGQQVAQLNGQLSGLKIQVGGPTVEALSRAIQAFHSLTGIVQADSIVRQESMGLMSHQEAVIRASAAAAGDMWAATRKLTDAESAQLTATLDVTDATTRHTTELTFNQEVVRQSSAQYENLGTNLYGLSAATAAASAAAQDHSRALKKTADDAQLAANQAQLLAAGLAGTLTHNYEQYRGVVDGSAKRVAELRAEITKLTAAQGQNVTVVTQGQYSAEQLAVAQERLTIAQERLAAGHYKTAAALDSANLAVRVAQDSVDRIAGHMATVTTTTADYSKKIGEAQTELDGLTGANDRAADAMAKANAQFVYQQAAAGLTGQAALDFALAMGQIDQKTYDATIAIQKANAEYRKTGDLGAYESATRSIIDAVNGVAPPIDKMPEVLGPATQAYKDQTKAINDMAVAIGSLPTEVTSHISIITDHIDNYGSSQQYGAADRKDEPTPRAAAGRDMIVPDRYTNDSYGVMAQAGERVIVIPPGQPGNGGGPLGLASGASGGSAGGDTIIINDRAATALYLERKRAERLAGMERRI